MTQSVTQLLRPHPLTAQQTRLLQLADTALILGQRNAEWCGNGPVLEEDIALANISLDLIGQARLLYQHCAELVGNGTTEDDLAYFRGASDFLNLTLVELPHSATAGVQRDYAFTIVRSFLFSAFMLPTWSALLKSTDTQLAAIAERSVKETRYHLRHSRDWLVKLGDGTTQSHDRAQAALNYLLPFTAEFWVDTAADVDASATGRGVLPSTVRPTWLALVQDAALEATLDLPAPWAAVGNSITSIPDQNTWNIGKLGQHSAHLEPLLADMQSLARQHPGANW